MINPRIYEVNTRVWIKQFGNDARLSDIPDDFINSLQGWGIDALWMMGIWKNNPETVEKYCFEPALIASYNNSLPDWQKNDVIGSPYSIDTYEINPSIGTEQELVHLRKRLNDKGIKLILDFVPNHFSSYSGLLKTNPEIFLPSDHALFKSDSYTFFPSPYDKNKYFTHGRDPLFPPWKDTVQVNFFNDEARKFLIQVLSRLTNFCDGVRCDMAMLPLNNVFYNTWVGILKKYGIEKPATEFWEEAIGTIKNINRDFIFIAEAYWDLEWHLQQLGFDFTYDKRLTDRLGSADLRIIKDHLRADMDFQLKSVRFIENHDEERAASKFGKDRSLPAAMVISTLPGMILYHDGQFEGRKIKLPVQLGRSPQEKSDKRIFGYYDKLLKITKQDAFKLGTWQMLDCLPVSTMDLSNENLFAWEWTYKDIKKIVVINYSNSTAKCRIILDIPAESDSIKLFDELHDNTYIRQVAEIRGIGLYVELKAYNSHIFSISIKELLRTSFY